MKRRARLILGVVAGLAGIAAVAGWRLSFNRAPYGPETLNAHAILQIVDQKTADAALLPVNSVVAGDGDQIVLGKVSWSRPAEPQVGGSYRIVLLDKRTHLTPGVFSVNSVKPEDVNIGSDHALDKAQKRYPWLQGAGTTKVDGKNGPSGTSIEVHSVYAAPITFQAVLPKARPDTPDKQQVATAPAAVEDLMLALISVGPDEQIYWAQRLVN